MASSPDDDSPYHEGERALQERSGVRARAEALGRKMIRDFMPEQHRELFAQLPMLFVGSLDRAGLPWASVLWGEPGFVSSPDARTLSVAPQHLPAPLGDGLELDAPLGLLGIELRTRRRNRVNGRVVRSTGASFDLSVDQSFGNCPQYIQARSPSYVPSAPLAARPELSALSERALHCIERSDTCFIASACSARFSRDPRCGVDVSHRGGRPGFVRVQQESHGHVLTMPDFSGNNAFNTLGNLLRYPRAGLLFVDFEAGDLLQLTCETELLFEGDELSRFAGAQRLLRLRVMAGRLLPAAFPFRSSAPEPAPQIERTGSWSDRT